MATVSALEPGAAYEAQVHAVKCRRERAMVGIGLWRHAGISAGQHAARIRRLGHYHVVDRRKRPRWDIRRRTVHGG